MLSYFSPDVVSVKGIKISLLTVWVEDVETIVVVTGINKGSLTDLKSGTSKGFTIIESVEEAPLIEVEDKLS